LQGGWSYQRLQLLPSQLRGHNHVTEAHQLARDGSNLANVFGTLPRIRQQQIASRLRDLIPLYADVDVKPSNPGHHRVVFQDRWNDSIWYDPQNVSDGTMILLAFLTLAHMQAPPDVLAIEEPEYALHPYLLGEVVDLLRKLALGELGSRSVQVIIATHS